MSLYGMMRTGVSGMNAQANRLSTVADNIANAGTTGYKRSSTEFASMVLPSSPGSYNSGGVNTHVRTQVSDAGVLQYTNSSTDMAIDGDGFFVVQDQSGSTFLTRAGAFVPDDEGHLVNAAGYRLMGYSYANGTPTTTANGFGGMEAVTISRDGMVAQATREGVFSANLPATANTVAAADLPSANGVSATYSAKTSLVAYDDVGGQVMLDVYFTKTGANTWEVAVYNRADAAPNTTFPYSSGPVATQTLNFDSSTGHLASASADSIDIAIPGGQTANVDLSSMSELSSDFSIFNAGVDGNPPSSIEALEISGDGTCYAQYTDGSIRALYRIPLATVPSPDNLQSLAGNVYSQSPDSGSVRVGFPNESGMGGIVTGALENSNVDVATELTTMIESQRSYTANSKVFQTGSELMDVLVNLKR